MVEFSIIVPVYQVRKYLERLINSVLSQDYTNYELLLVDDGSSDGSEKICDTFSEKFAHIKTIHKKNGGVSSARNEGIRNAQGKYLIFLDADDYIDKGFLVDASNKLEKNAVDILVFGYYVEAGDILTSVPPQMKGFYDIKRFSENFASFAQETSFNSVWNKVFCSDIIKENKLEFQNQKIAEDGIFVCQYLQKAKSYYFSDKVYYHYCQNGGSAVHKFCDSRWIDENNYLQEIEKCVKILCPDNVQDVMGVKYRNAVLFDVYNLLESDDSILKCARILKEHLNQIYALVDWNLNTPDQMLKLQLELLRRCRTFEIIALMRFKKKLSELGKSDEN